MYCGSYIGKIKNNEIDTHFDLKGTLCTVLCIKETEGDVYVVIYSHDAEGAEDFFQILSKTKQHIGKTVKLPDEFLAYIKNDEAAIYGCFDRIEIHNKDACAAVAFDELELLQFLDE